MQAASRYVDVDTSMLLAAPNSTDAGHGCGRCHCISASCSRARHTTRWLHLRVCAVACRSVCWFVYLHHPPDVRVGRHGIALMECSASSTAETPPKRGGEV